ncbi:MAG TPA: Ig-like domain-containing protein [Terracidiphilus sp.]|jgi:hypothetical protein
MFCRGLRFTLAVGLGVALATPLSAAAPVGTQQATQTTLLVDTRDMNGLTEANLFVAVSGADGLPAAGSISIMDHGKPLAGFTLDPQGQAIEVLELAPGNHNFTAIYTGDSSHLTSKSEVTPIAAVSTSTPGFTVAVAPGTLSLAQGQSGSAVVSVTPVNAASLASPMFVTISCSGLPDQSACTFTPENIEIPVGGTAAINSTMVIATETGTLTGARNESHRDAAPIAWAVFPGVLALAGLAFGARRRRFLSRLALIALLALITVFGASACSPLYNYHNHGPNRNLPTPAGNYTVKIAAQSSNGVTANTQYTSVALTVTAGQ